MEINCLCFYKHCIGSTVYLDPCMEKKVYFRYFSHKKDGDKLSLLHTHCRRNGTLSYSKYINLQCKNTIGRKILFCMP